MEKYRADEKALCEAALAEFEADFKAKFKTDKVEIDPIMNQIIDEFGAKFRVTKAEFPAFQARVDAEFAKMEDPVYNAKVTAEFEADYAARVEANKARVDAEKARVEAEKARVEAHKARVEAHKARVEKAEGDKVDAKIDEFIYK
eukprot:GHVL01004825.1.p1 GENE.GHVL01004825.1~~GHVL01004825.1.p1  ORF type:complete len:155 (-),score=54.01 GHVL01004825.1:15-449(-)